MLFAQQNTVKTANWNSRINFYFVTSFYHLYDICIYGHENEMYNVGVSLKEGEGLKMRELRVGWEKMGDKTKCAKG